MEKKIVVSSVPSVGIGTLAWIALIILRATGHIAMSWFWVITSIIWIPIGLVVTILILMLVVAFIAALVSR